MKFCDETERTPIHADPCRGWVEEGWPWHGCTLEPNHELGRRRRHHTCKCGHEWETRHGRK